MSPAVSPAAGYPGTEFAALDHAANYYRWIIAHFEPALGPTVLEVGAGVGHFSDCLLRTGRVRRLFCVEPAENLIPALRARFAGRSEVEVIPGYLEDLGERRLDADAVACVNVLEHVGDDMALLRAMRRQLASGGRLLLFVPALPGLMGTLDEAFGHRRRYTRETLGAALRGAGFTIRRLRYFNLPGVVTWALAGKVLRRPTMFPRDVRLYDRLVVPWWRRVEDRLSPPIGQSLLAIAVRPDVGMP